MGAAWRTVRVFVSSTFGDMHAERTYLVTHVFPRLRDWCERRHIDLREVDLRWGITEYDATHHKRVLEACLGRIDECELFIGFLGQRYGWVPTADEVNPETLARYPHLAEWIAEGRSARDFGGLLGSLGHEQVALDGSTRVT
jgi:hypothetical protein